MTSNNNQFWLLALFLILGLGCGVFFTGRDRQQQQAMGTLRASGNGAQATQSPLTSESLADLPEKDRTALNVLKSIFSASIDVFCKVVDEKGNPVPGADVEYSLNDKYFKSGSKGQTVSAPDGSFRTGKLEQAARFLTGKRPYCRTGHSTQGLSLDDRIYLHDADSHIGG